MGKLAALLAAPAMLFIVACSPTSPDGSRPAMRFDTVPVEFSQNPKMMAKLEQTFTSNEDELIEIAQRIEAENKKAEETEAAIAALEEAESKPPEPTPLPESDLIY